MTLDEEYVYNALKGFWPTSPQVTLASAGEIARTFTKLELGPLGFDDALAKYRDRDKKGNWPPTLRQLRPYMPRTRAAMEARPDREKQVSLWPSRLIHSPRYDEALKLYGRGKFVEFAELLLSQPGLSEEERLNAEAVMRWAEYWESDKNVLRTSGPMTDGKLSGAVKRVLDGMAPQPAF